MNNNLESAKLTLNQAKNILLTTHERTDGDDLGTVLALWHELRRQKKLAHITITGGVPPALRFLPGAQLVTEYLPKANYDLLVISGCSQKQRVGNPDIMGLGIPILNIDHHPDNTLHGTVNLVDPTKSAVAELAYDLFIAANFNINYEVAMCLLTGIFTDTGSFMHSNTQASTLKASAELMRKGAHPATIARHAYKGKSIKTLQSWSKALSNTWYNPEQKIVCTILTDKDLLEIDNPSGAVFEGFIETLNKIPEAKFALFLKQDGDNIKGSLRSDPHKKINVGALARALGGGGHTWASGFSIFGKLEKNSFGKWSVIH